MEAVVVHHDGKTTLPLLSVHGEEPHRLIVQSHQLSERPCLLRIDIVVVSHRSLTDEHRVLQVEEVAVAIIIQVRIEAQEARHPHQEHKVEVRILALTLVQPLQRVHQIGKERSVRLLLAQRPVEKLRNKESDGRLHRIIGNRLEGHSRLRLLDARQSPAPRTNVRLNLHHSQRLEEHRLHRRLSRARQRHQEGAPTVQVGVDIDNQRRVIILKGVNHNPIHLLQHIQTKLSSPQS